MEEMQQNRMDLIEIRNKDPKDRTPAEQKFLEDKIAAELDEKYDRTTIDGQVKKAIKRKH